MNAPIIRVSRFLTQERKLDQKNGKGLENELGDETDIIYECNFFQSCNKSNFVRGLLTRPTKDDRLGQWFSTFKVVGSVKAN